MYCVYLLQNTLCQDLVKMREKSNTYVYQTNDRLTNVPTVHD